METKGLIEFRYGDGQQIFIAVVTDTQWRAFCEAFGRPGLLADAALATNALRVAARDRLLPELRELFKTLTGAQISRLCEASNIGFAPIRRPDELFGLARALVEAPNLTLS